MDAQIKKNWPGVPPIPIFFFNYDHLAEKRHHSYINALFRTWNLSKYAPFSFNLSQNVKNVDFPIFDEWTSVRQDKRCKPWWRSCLTVIQSSTPSNMLNRCDQPPVQFFDQWLTLWSITQPACLHLYCCLHTRSPPPSHFQPQQSLAIGLSILRLVLQDRLC